MSISVKLAAFDHVVNQLIGWYTEKHGNWHENDLSRLKITKLLFFVSAVTAKQDEYGLLNIFDNFSALPYGHVESDIQDRILESSNYLITKDALSFQDGVQTYEKSPELSENLEAQVDEAVRSLKAKNPDLISYSAFDLVELSHRWQSWKTIFALAKQNGKLSMKIPREMIMSEPKIFI
ncbi:type II toxin-antitoxin system antitoxin SocA domain-containing protein [Mucilaginibacter sp. RCC_168]|uniref:type II toxin-antitoxin system antitoxin SocA domain-containing protein n=1 Tax=Mucilaginibacter sp. RCC_168 TaxID=3239221 RepID=UPI00352593D1